MSRKSKVFMFIGAAAIGLAASTSEAQVSSYNNGFQNILRPQRVFVGRPTRVYSNNGVKYQSYRPNYDQSRVYSNGGYYVQPQQQYYYNTPSSEVQPSTSYYSYPSTTPSYSSNSVYSSQPSNVYQNYYGNGVYSTPQQAANANTGAIIGSAIGGNQGAQVGAAIGASIRP